MTRCDIGRARLATPPHLIFSNGGGVAEQRSLRQLAVLARLFVRESRLDRQLLLPRLVALAAHAWAPDSSEHLSARSQRHEARIRAQHALRVHATPLALTAASWRPAPSCPPPSCGQRGRLPPRASWRDARPPHPAPHTAAARHAHTRNDSNRDDAVNATRRARRTQHDGGCEGCQQHDTAETQSTRTHPAIQHTLLLRQHLGKQRLLLQLLALLLLQLQPARVAHGGGATRNTAQHSTAQHSTAQHSTAQHSTAQHSTAQHSKTPEHALRHHRGTET